MELIKKLNERTKSKKQRKIGLFLCPYCNQEVKKEIVCGLRNKSCGCFRTKLISQKNTTHGFTKNGKTHPLYRVWTSMKSRCFCKSNSAYKYYGERGVVVCREWQNDFMAFYKWSTENGYKKNLQIDRKDNDGNYEPENCRWITHAENQQNSRNVKLDWNSVETIRAKYKKHKDRKIVSELAEQYDVSKTIIRKIVNNLKWESIQ